MAEIEQTNPELNLKPEPPEPEKPNNKLRTLVNKFFGNWSKRKKIIVASIVAILVLVFAVPFTRYKVLGLVIKKDVTIKVMDASLNTPVSEAEVSIHGKSQTTDGNGEAKISGVPVGEATIRISKNYYQEASFERVIGIGSAKTIETKLTAVGKPVKLEVVNKISKQPVPNASVKVMSTTSKTDDNGKTVLVVAPEAKEINVNVTANGFNTVDAKLTISNKDLTVEITPAGKLYFLSKQSGKIDVVKTNLDGSDRKVVLAGTGNESETDTILLASRDWKYLALKAKRDTKKDFNSVYLINTADDKLSTIDEGNADFELKGWAGHYLILKVDRREVQYNQPDKQRLKSYNAETQKLITLDRSNATNLGPGMSQDYYYQDRYYIDRFDLVSITDNTVLYIKDAEYSGACEEATNGIYTIQPDGTQKKTILQAQLKDKTINGWSAFTYKPGEIYYQTTEPNCSGTAQTKSYEYEIGGAIKAIDESEFNKGTSNYRSFVVSPNGKEAFWSESRDRKNVFFLGNLDLEDEKEIAKLEEHTVYGWYNQDYLLISRKGSELFIMSRTGTPIKVTDYHKPAYDYKGYGYGYGGF